MLKHQASLSNCVTVIYIIIPDSNISPGRDPNNCGETHWFSVVMQLSIDLSYPTGPIDKTHQPQYIPLDVRKSYPIPVFESSIVYKVIISPDYSIHLGMNERHI